MNSINYSYFSRTVTQLLGTVYYGDLEGDFDAVIKRFNSEYEHYRRYIDQPQQVNVNIKYLDGVNSKVVKFDRIYLTWRYNYDEKELCIMGERNMDAGELAVYELELEKGKQREIEQLKQLMAKYPEQVVPSKP